MLYQPVPNSPVTGVPAAFSSPVGGWNARDPLNAMKPQDAVRLINWFPRQGDVITRLGHTEHVDLETSETVQNLHVFEYGTATQLLAFSDGEFFDASDATPGSIENGFDPTPFVSDMMGGLLFLANGVDDVQIYDGSTMEASDFTGVDLGVLNFVKSYKHRLYFIEKNSQKMWYGPLAGVTGALTSFDFKNVGGFSGNLVLLGSLSRDGGAGKDDLFVAVFASGDAAVYTGTDPSDASEWSLLGRFKLGRPLGRFASFETEADLYLLTDRGYEQVSRVLPMGQETPASKLISDKISGAVTEAIKLVGPSDNWRACLVPTEEMFLVNVPSSSATLTPTQHVRNINTKAWCLFAGLDIRSFILHGSFMYFGTSDGRVMKYGTSTLDDGESIRVDCQTAWNFLGERRRNKLVTHMQPSFVAFYMPTVSLAIGANYVDPPIGVASSYSSAQAELPEWDSFEWDAMEWAAESRAFQRWHKRTKRGRCVCARIFAITPSRIQWNEITYLHQPGGVIK